MRLLFGRSVRGEGRQPENLTAPAVHLPTLSVSQGPFGRRPYACPPVPVWCGSPGEMRLHASQRSRLKDNHARPAGIFRGYLFGAPLCSRPLQKPVGSVSGQFDVFQRV